MIDKRVCIVGLGLMGGSLAKALDGKVKGLIGVDHHAATRQFALAEGIFDRVSADLPPALTDTDLVILATPVQTILRQLDQLPVICPDGLLVMDLGSTKEAVCQKMALLPHSFSAIGGHPMCGKEHAGFSAADADLFKGQIFVLSKNSRTNEAVESLALDLIAQIGAEPLFMEARDHDKIVAVTSHLPYLLSTLLIHRAIETEDERVWPVSASGFRDTSRLAGSDPAMMLDILLTNREAILSALSRYRADLERISRFLFDGDESAITSWLAGSQSSYHEYQKNKKSWSDR